MSSPTIGQRFTGRDNEGRLVSFIVEWIEPDQWPYAWVWGVSATGKRAGVRIVTN